MVGIFIVIYPITYCCIFNGDFTMALRVVSSCGVLGGGGK